MKQALYPGLPLFSLLLLVANHFAGTARAEESAEGTALPNFRMETIDDSIQIGYGVAIGDVDGDKKPDILLADKLEFVWYRNPDWKRFVIAGDRSARARLSARDNVCIAARDIDGDGKVEIAVGANWNPGETSDESKSGSVHYLIPPADGDRTKRWTPVKLPHEPTVHRMRWLQSEKGTFQLVVAPLHGRGNRNGQGAAVKVLAYERPADASKAADWNISLVDNSMHKTHNVDIVPIHLADHEMLALAGAEGVREIRLVDKVWKSTLLPLPDVAGGAGEVRFGQPLKNAPSPFTGFWHATIEPMHGNHVALYHAKLGESTWSRTILDDTLSQGHALAVGDVLGQGYPQVIAGWRAPDERKKTGIRIYSLAIKGEHAGKWTTHELTDAIACEDLRLADLNGDGKLEIIAAGRSTHNLVVWWNKG